MTLSVLFFGMVPLLAFVIIDSFAGLKTGLIAGILFALAEAVYSVIAYGAIDELTIGSTALILIFGFLSFKSQKEIYFKLQPVFLGVTCGLILVVMQAFGKPLLVMMLNKYQLMIPSEMREMIMHPESMRRMAVLSGILGWGFLLHAALVAYSAFRMSKWWWLIIRGVGFYVMLFVCAMLVNFV